MRIDFGGSYKEVSRLLKASTTPTQQTAGSGFEAGLQRAITSPSQDADLIAKSTHRTGQPQSEYDDPIDMRASFNFAEPGLELPELKPQGPLITPEEVSPQPQTPQQSVKTPTVLDVRRVEMAGPAIQNPIASADREGIRVMLNDAGQKFGINPQLSMAVVRAESDFNPRAVSTDGHASKGLFQLLDSTGRELLARGEQPSRSYNPFDASLNVELGTSYLRYLHDIFSKPTDLPNDYTTVPAADKNSLEKLAVAAFNAGEGRVASAQHRAERAGKQPGVYEEVEPYLPKSTQTYVNRVVSGKTGV